MEFGAELLFESTHLSAIGFMIVTGQVQHAMQDENLDFREQVVADPSRLGASPLHGDGDIAARRRLSGRRFSGAAKSREGEHVGRRILAAELQVEALNLSVAGEQNINLTGEPGGALSFVRKTRQGEAAKLFRISSF